MDLNHHITTSLYHHMTLGLPAPVHFFFNIPKELLSPAPFQELKTG
jgi:hypothetical protein